MGLGQFFGLQIRISDCIIVLEACFWERLGYILPSCNLSYYQLGSIFNEIFEVLGFAKQCHWNF